MSANDILADLLLNFFFGAFSKANLPVTALYYGEFSVLLDYDRRIWFNIDVGGIF